MRRSFRILVLICLAAFVAVRLGKIDGAWFTGKLPLLKQHASAVFAVCVVWVLGFIVGRLRGGSSGRSWRYRFQNPGEARLTGELMAWCQAPDYHLLNHLTVRTEEGTTQIDHVLVSRFGVFVIETKDYQGWIFADPNDRQWTKVLYRVKFRFQNPIRQNYKHVCAIRELLDFLPADAIRSIVVFTGNAEFKTGIPDGVFTPRGFLVHLAHQTTEVMSVNRLQFCVGRLETARLSMTKTTDVQHVEALRRRYGHDD